MKLNFAQALSLESAKAVLFGANTQGAGVSQSFVGQTLLPQFDGLGLFSADAIRKADNESPGLPDNLRLGTDLFDIGNLDLNELTPAQSIEVVKQTYSDFFSQDKIVIGLGGDHLIKYAALSAVSDRYPGCGIVYVDAHPDTVHSEKIAYNSILSHTFGLPGLSPCNTTIVGLRQLDALEAKGLKTWNPHVVRSSNFPELGVSGVFQKIRSQLHACGSIYLSIDLDGIDPSSAPAVEAAYPGRPTLDDMIYLIRSISNHFRIIGMDISEHLPQLDTFKLTALTSARILKEVYSHI